MGRVSDRVGRRPVLLLSLLGSTVSLVISGLAPSLVVLIVARALAGLFGGSIATAQAYIADVTAPTERAKYMGLLGASIGMGFVFGPAIGASLSGFGFGTAAFAAAGLAGANFVFAFFALPESRRQGESSSESSSPRARVSAGGLAAALASPTVARVLLASFLATFAMVSLEAVAALAGEHKFGLGTRELGVGFFLIGIVVTIVQGGLVGRLVSHFGERNLALAGSVIMAASLLALPFAPSLALVTVAVLLLSAGQGLVTPTLSSLLSRASDADQQGGVLGVGQSVASLARMIGPLVAGWLFDRGEALPFVVGGLLVILAAWTMLDDSVRPTRRAIRADALEPATVTVEVER
jgi:MFS transporter, DHA1 family, tetracycline resistance protein